jgi:hypothetical protein
MSTKQNFEGFYLSNCHLRLWSVRVVAENFSGWRETSFYEQ